MTQGRAQELKAALDGVEGRLSVREMEVWHRMVRQLVSIAPNEVRTEAPQHGGRFACEDDGVADAGRDSDSDKELEVPQRIVFDTVSEQRRQRAQRQRHGYSKNVVVVCGYVAYTTDYTAETLEEEKQDFLLGRVACVNARYRTISILMFHTSKLRNGDTAKNARGARYYKWRKRKDAIDIPLGRVLDVVKELTPGAFIPKRQVRYIMAAKQLQHEDAITNAETSRLSGADEEAASSSSDPSDQSSDGCEQP